MSGVPARAADLGPVVLRRAGRAEAGRLEQHERAVAEAADTVA